MKDQTVHSPAEYFRLFNEINIIAQLSSRLFEQQLPTGMNQSQFSVLNWFFRVDSEASPGRLAAAFQVTRGAMTNTLKKLEAKGFIEISPDADSGRQKRVTMTAAGRAMRDECIAGVSPLLAEFAAAAPAADPPQLIASLAEIREYLDDYRSQAHSG
ncbi:MAG: MarR family transcriptional regulator [Gammaproteobacteria bacterium]